MARGRRAFAAFAALAVLGGVAACSGDDDAATTTTSAEEDVDGQESVTTTTLSDEEYSEEVDSFSAALEEAAATGDVCEVIAVQNSAAPPVAGNAEQMEQVVELAAQVLRSYAVGVEDPELVAGLEKMADDLVAEAEADGYPLDFLERAPASVSSEEAQQLFARFTEIVQPKCLPDSTPPDEGDAPDEQPADAPG